MFLMALKAEIEIDNNFEKEEKFHELLKNAEHIITRIKNNAATCYGLVGGSAMDHKAMVSVLSAKPFSPSCYRPIEKCWHFDTASVTRS